MRASATGRFELELQSENVGAWMAINNAFTYDWGSSTSRSPGARAPHSHEFYWNGVLVQLGKLRNIENDELMEGFKEIQFWGKSGLIGILAPRDFEGGNIVWINIVKKGSRQEPVPLRAFRERFKLGEIRESGFARARSLHHYLQPYPGGITLWHEDGYEVAASFSENRHMSHTFKLGENVQIEVLRLRKEPGTGQRWQVAQSLRKPDEKSPEWTDCPGDDLSGQEENGSPDARNERLFKSKVDRIVVTHPGAGGHNIGKNPPQSP